MNRLRTIALLAGLAAVGAALPLVLVSQSGPTPAASYTADGGFIMPADWRRWVHVASTSTPNGLNDGAAQFPGFHNTYIDPVAYDHWVATGTFPDGTVFLKELVDFLDPAYADESSDQIAGRGHYPDRPIGVGVAVKDTVRFADEPGGWAYFSVPAVDGEIAESGSILPNLRNAAPD